MPPLDSGQGHLVENTKKHDIQCDWCMWSHISPPWPRPRRRGLPHNPTLCLPKAVFVQWSDVAKTVVISTFNGELLSHYIEEQRCGNVLLEVTAVLSPPTTQIANGNAKCRLVRTTPGRTSGWHDNFENKVVVAEEWWEDFIWFRQGRRRRLWVSCFAHTLKGKTTNEPACQVLSKKLPTHSTV